MVNTTTDSSIPNFNIISLILSESPISLFSLNFDASCVQGLLKEARKEIEEKDREISRLTQEIVELRLKASLNSPDERTDSSDALTVRESNPFSPESPSKDLPDEGAAGKTVTPDAPKEQTVQTDLSSSLVDSGHFEDGSVHSKESKESVCLPESQPDVTISRPTSADVVSSDVVIGAIPTTPTKQDEERRRLVSHYENRIEDMHRQHIDDIQELKQKHNDKV